MKSKEKVLVKKEVYSQKLLSGMTALYNSKAFTLIELLVVVLIVGILAAVALPQYQKAVEKTRLTELVHEINIIKKISALHLLENGTPATLHDISPAIEWGGTWQHDGDYWYYTTNFFVYNCDVAAVTSGLYCEIYRLTEKNNYMSDSLYALAIAQDTTTNTWENMCFTWNSNLGSYACQTLHQWDNSLAIVDGEL